jgi:hypothetical protein
VESSSRPTVETRRDRTPKPWALALTSLGILFVSGPVNAADHNDPIGVQASFRSGDSSGYEVNTNDPAADIADLLAWYTGDRGNPTSVVLALTWRADPLAGREKEFDPTVKYGIHIDTSDKGLLDISANSDGLSLGSKLHTVAANDITVWFGESKKQKGSWGVLVNGLPGVSGNVVGPVGKVIEPVQGVKVAAGLFDDPFFADLDGFFNAVSVALGNRPGSNPSLPPDRFNKVNPRAATRPFGYPVGVDGFGKQNIHAVVIELPASAFPGRKLHVWGTTERKQGLPKFGENLKCSYDANGGIYQCGAAQ